VRNPQGTILKAKYSVQNAQNPTRDAVPSGRPRGRCHVAFRMLHVAFCLAACLVVPACQQKMAVQPSGRPDQTSDFFPNGQANRPLVAYTVARGHLRTDLALFTGKRKRDTGEARVAASVLGGLLGRNLFGALAAPAAQDSNLVDRFPFPVTQEVLEQGRDRYMIYCIVCHDARGTGRGKIVERGYTPPPSFHLERLRRAPVGHFFEVMTNGYGSMPDYKQQVPPRDRWAIAAYIRALQLSQHFPEKDLTPDMRAAWEKQQGGRAE
jgi:mono/diheme cytochrome c family protein